jgi:predicted HicB family RNase H-like nuclease
MQERFKLSVHRSCRLALLQRSTWYAKSEAWDQSALRQRIRDIALSRPGFGYLRVLVMLQRESLRASIHAGARVCAWRPTSGCRVGALRRRWTIEGLAGRLQPPPSTQLARQPDPETVADLRHEFEVAIEDFLDDCKEQGIKPEKPALGKLMLRVPPEVHEAALIAAQASGKSLDQWATEVLQSATHA